MKNAFDVLNERGFIQQTTHEEEIRNLFANEQVTFYIGFDPTADSLTIGHFLTIKAMMHLQQCGHRPVVLLGGGTGMVGDPTDKTEMRRIMLRDEIQHNVDCFRKQMERFIDFSDGKAIMANNADWLLELSYVPFIREYGVHFSVNRMLTAECYKSRFEKGLSFFEFNYMIMQSYDFLELFRRHNCKMQLGGNDQWSNILGGVELIRRVENASAYGMTFTLLQTSDGKKMGKTQKGALWISPEKTTPYEFFQYLRNVDDADVGTCLSLLTFLPMEEVNRLKALEGSEINKAKEILAYETTKIVHGKEEADKALQAAQALFAGGELSGSIPTTTINKEEAANLSLIELLEKTKLFESKSDARRNITQGGVKINGEKVSDIDYKITDNDFKDGIMVIQKGKKVFHHVVLGNYTP